MKHGLIMITFLMLMTACSSVNMTPGKIDTMNEVSPQTITLEQTDYISKVESNQDMKLVNSENDDNVETQTSGFISSQTGEEKEIETLSIVEEPSEARGDESEDTYVEDYIMIGDTKYINLMKEEKFQDWIKVAEKYGAALYAIPYSDVFAIVKDGEVLVGMSTGVASAAPNHIDILCDLMIDKGEAAEKLIEGINHVAQTGESVQLTVGDNFSIEKQDEWIVVSW
jgi:hypothetical protein